MGMMTGLLGLGRAAGQIGQVAEVLVGNRAEQHAAAAARATGALEQFAAEFDHPAAGPFDRFVDGLNRLPRPMLALGTLGLFVHAMIEPVSFALRMEGLAVVPEPLWWLLGVIVSFYFGARELYHHRNRPAAAPLALRTVAASGAAPSPAMPSPAPRPAPLVEVRAEDPEFNAALAEWRTLNR
jgi:hypothetical protein